jgi:hypothetical protein
MCETKVVSLVFLLSSTLKKTKLRGLNPQANYTGQATAACRWSKCQFLRVEGVSWSAQRIPTAVNLGFLNLSLYVFIQVAPQLSSRGWVDLVPEPLLLRKSGRAGNRSRVLWICSQKLWPLDHRYNNLQYIIMWNPTKRQCYVLLILSFQRCTHYLQSQDLYFRKSADIVWSRLYSRNVTRCEHKAEY